MPRELEGDAGGGAVGEDVVHRPTVGVQVFTRLRILPVSYTHLDVYKRQPYHTVPASFL